MLVEIGNRIVNTDFIVSVEPWPTRGTGSSWRLTLTKGEPITLSHPHPGFAALCGTTIPAQPGFLVVEALLPDGTEPDVSVRYRTSTVLAFRIQPDSHAPAPITARGEMITTKDVLVAVVDPSGLCIEASAPYDSLKEFKAHCEAVGISRRDKTLAAKGGQPAPRSAGRKPLASMKLKIGASVLELRTHILAEPIEVLSERAEWRQGDDSLSVIRRVCDRYQHLHAQGVGLDPTWAWKPEAGGLEKARAQMMEPASIGEFERALRFLSYAGLRFPTQRINQKRTSYSWKHAAERIMGGYISNGMLIAAAYALGFHVVTDKASLNARINLAEEAILLDPGNGIA